MDRLQAAPAIEEIADFCLSGDNPCQRETGDTVRMFVEEGWRVVDTPPNTVISATLNSTAGDAPVSEAAFVVVLIELGPVDDSESRVVDANGGTVFELSTGESNVVTTVNWVLSRETDGSWRVFSIMAVA